MNTKIANTSSMNNNYDDSVSNVQDDETRQSKKIQNLLKLISNEGNFKKLLASFFFNKITSANSTKKPPEESQNATKTNSPPLTTLISLTFLLFLLVFCFAVCCTLATEVKFDQQQVSAKRRKQDERINLVAADENGIYLVGLFDLHKSDSRTPLKCGRIELDAGESNSRRSMQNYEAFLWAIEQVNADKSLLPGVTLGSLALDTCSSVVRSNQQLANLLHDEHNSSLTSEFGLAASQIAAIIADQADWLSLQGTLEMASAQKITTFVTQSRSSKLASFALKYGTPTGSKATPKRSGLARLAENDAEPVIDLSLQEALEAQASQNVDLGLGGANMAELRELLIKKGFISIGDDPIYGDGKEGENPDGNNYYQLHMIRMPQGNDLLAETLALLLQQMDWSFVSVVHEASEKISPGHHDRSDLYDLHEEFMRQILARQLQLALDEEIPGSPGALQSLIVSLAQKSAIGARVVVCLLSTGNSRRLLESLHLIRSSGESSESLLELVNSLVWITIADREPYYARASDALGSVAISSAVPLIPEFKSHFEQLESEKRARTNRWWPEYLHSILALESSKISSSSSSSSSEDGAIVGSQLSLLKAECSRNLQEASKSPAEEHCRTLSLAKLVELLRQQSAASPARQKLSLRGVEFSKYLAGGWEHNGMDVINSVLAAANGLEAIRQALCPGFAVGLCPEMRRLVWGAGQQLAGPEKGQKVQLQHSLSELMYSELLRSSFQLADGRMFKLDELHSQGGAQLEGKLKLYNLRYLQANSVGFVRFGQYDQAEGLLELNSSKARYYPTSGGRRMRLMSDGQPLERMKSSCEDERQCLMLAGLLGAQTAASGGQYLDSAESSSVLAMGEAELAANMNTLFKLDHPALMSGEEGKLSHTGDHPISALQQQQQQSDVHIHTMRSKMPLLVNWTSSAGQRPAPPHLRFNVIVLLPLHEPRPASRGITDPTMHKEDPSAAPECGQMDIERSFQQLVALAYAQGQVNSAMLAALPEEDATERSFSRIELTTSVIDYCGHPELAARKLAHLLPLATQRDSPIARANGLPVAVIDFEGSLGEQVERQLAGQKLLHLSLGAAAAAAAAVDLSTSSSKEVSSAGRSAKTASQSRKERENYHLRLAASPRDEIRALVSLLLAMPNWRLIHLIYTDRQERGDEFVQLANEANICVSKLIWLPPNELERPEAAEEQLEKTRRLFSREIHDYSAATSGGGGGGGGDPSEGLNATRVLVLLASSNPLTNQLILEAASPSMLEHYVWLSSHEWFSSIELPLSSSSVHAHRAVQPEQLPRLFLATKPESFESAAFRAYLSSLSPAIHEPIPTHWFDEFWQQRFSCRLPGELSTFAGTGKGAAKSPFREGESGSGSSSGQPLPLCSDPHFQAGPSVQEDELSHQAIEAIEAIQASLLAGSAGGNATDDCHASECFSPERFARDVARALSLVRESRAFGHPLAHLPVGFQIVHRVPIAVPAVRAQGSSGARRSNSRHLWSQDHSDRITAQFDHLARIGLWRDGQLLLMNTKKPMQSGGGGGAAGDQQADNNSLHHLWWLQQQASSTGGAGDDDDNSRSDTGGSALAASQQLAAEASLAKLASVRSRCFLPSTCALCGLQLERAARVRQEAALATLAAAGDPQRLVPDDARLASKQPSASSQLAGGLSSADAASRSLRQQPATASVSDDTPRPPTSASRSDGESTRKMQASDSLYSLHGQQQQGPPQHHRWPISGSAVTGQRRSWALLVSVACLVGVVGALAAGSSYVKQRDPAVCPEELAWARIGYGSRSGSGCMSKQARARSSSASSINDYFLLTGLLMLYSINVAFLLPATGAVCWLRRTGLTTSYTLIFTAILVRALASWGESMSAKAHRRKHLLVQQVNLAQLRKRSKKHHQEVQVSGLPQPRNVSTSAAPSEIIPTAAMKPDPIDDEGVELTFESLPHESQVAQVHLAEELAPAQQQDASQSSCSSGTLSQQQPATCCCSGSGQIICDEACTLPMSVIRGRFTEPANLLALALLLLLAQLAFSLIWSLKQPAEPTLYLGCWLCASPIRSPIMALYEPLLSFLYPALILLLPGWYFSLANFRLMMRRHKLQVLAQAQASRTLQVHENLSYSIKLERREANSLLMSTTLLVFTWSALTLNMISLGNQKSTAKKVASNTINSSNDSSMMSVYQANSQASAGGSATTSTSESFNWENMKRAPTKLLSEYELSLVYANLISGAIIFSILFVYRLNLFQQFLRKLNSKHTNESSIGGRSNLHQQQTHFNGRSTGGRPSSNHHILKFNQNCPPQSSIHSFTGSEFSAPRIVATSVSSGQKMVREQERLRLHQQFSSASSYSTYSPTSHTSSSSALFADAATVAERTRKSHKNITTGSLKKRNKQSLFKRSPEAGKNSSQYVPNTGVHQKQKQKQQQQQQQQRSSEFKLQRRQSANSVASSTAKLVGSDQECDTISLGASSVASSSTSQVYGNELYPLDYSIQFDGPAQGQTGNQQLFQVAEHSAGGGHLLNRSGSFSRRSLRRSSVNKLDAVCEEQQSASKES